MANSQGTNEGEQITLDLSVIAWSTEDIQVPDELEETQMEIQLSDELEETWMQEDETMFFEPYLDYLKIQMKEDASTSEYEDEWLAEWKSFLHQHKRLLWHQKHGRFFGTP